MKKHILFLTLLFASIILSGCIEPTEFEVMKDTLENKEITLRTFDTNGTKTEEITSTKNILTGNRDFEDSFEGITVEDTNVLSFMLDDKQFVHVGSSLILAQKDLNDILPHHLETVEPNSDGLVNQILKNENINTSDSKYLLLIRSQNGIPISIYLSNSLNYFRPTIDNATGLKLDEKYLLLYRTDYTIYELDLFK